MAGVVDLLQTPAEETSKNAAALHEAAVKWVEVEDPKSKAKVVQRMVEAAAKQYLLGEIVRAHGWLTFLGHHII